MDDLKSVTVSYLRELARKHLGPGHSKLTKNELIAALAQFVPALKKLARLAGIELPTRSKGASQAAPSAPKPSRAREVPTMKKKEPEKKAAEKKAAERKAAEKKPAERKAAEKKPAERKKEPEKKAPEKKAAERRKEPEKKAPEKKEPERKAAAPQARKAAEPQRPAPARVEDTSSTKPAHVVNFPRRSRSSRHGEEAWEDGAELGGSPEQEAELQHPAEPLVEGFFVARVMGERELRRHHLTEDQSPHLVTSGALGHDENLGELPLDHGDDLALALARDPHTLFITWDFSAATRARASEGLEDARAVLRVFDGDSLVRELEVVLESRSFYIHGLSAGRSYRVEAHLVGRDGRSRRIGSSTHPVALPRTGPSPDTSVRFMRMPPPPVVPATGGAPAAVVPSVPSQEGLAEEREYITWRRVPLPGSAELAEVMESRRERITREAGEGARKPEHLEISLRPPGSSEQSAGRGPERGGASEQTHWTPPPSGRGR